MTALDLKVLVMRAAANLAEPFDGPALCRAVALPAEFGEFRALVRLRCWSERQIVTVAIMGRKGGGRSTTYRRGPRFAEVKARIEQRAAARPAPEPEPILSEHERAWREFRATLDIQAPQSWEDHFTSLSRHAA